MGPILYACRRARSIDVGSLLAALGIVLNVEFLVLGTFLARNVGLAAYAYGIAFVALSCWSEIRLRRSAPAWTLPPP